MLEFHNVSVHVGKTPILEDLSVSFERGKITSLIGPNGCGKTTLLQTLNGLSTVKSGKIMLDGVNYLEMPMTERAKHLSFMPQFRESAPNIRAKVLVEHGRFPYMGFSRKMGQEDIEAIQNAIEYTNISSFAEKKVNELSGGMQQRVYLAMQLAQNCDYMVMDEPMNYLDYPGQREMYRLVQDLREKGKTIILVLHDLGQALRISDQIVVMNHRKIAGAGTPKECLKSGVIESVFGCEVREVELDGTSQYIFL